MHPEAPKRIVIFLWVTAVSGFLYYFSASLGEPMTPKNFLNFAILLWGGGFAYHITTELISCPYNDSTKLLWKDLRFPLLKVYIGYMIVGIALFLAKKFGGEWGWLLAFVGVILGYLWIMHYIISLERPIKRIILASKSSNS